MVPRGVGEEDGDVPLRPGMLHHEDELGTASGSEIVGIRIHRIDVMDLNLLVQIACYLGRHRDEKNYPHKHRDEKNYSNMTWSDRT